MLPRLYTAANRMPYQPTPDQIASAKAKREERLRRKQNATITPTESSHLLLQRPWLPIPVPHQPHLKLKVMAWNLLAQCLVRRELFPNSDCLKAAERLKSLREELLAHNADIMCLQEVDRLDKLLPILDKAGYSHRYAAGRGKKHGCLIAFKRDIFTQTHERVVYYDEQPIRDAESERAQCGHSFKTRNIGLIVELSLRNDPDNGVIAATTHLFWHPKYAYERARQAGILTREVLDLQRTRNLKQWPCFIAGDFNSPPSDAAYALVTGQPLEAEHKERLAHSRVTHASIDPTITKDTNTETTEEEGGESEETDPDRVITNARKAIQSDGLLNDDELIALHARNTPLRSAYAEGLSKAKPSDVMLYGSRSSLKSTQPGFHEPAYTSFTHYWQSVLDYIFYIAPEDTCTVSGLLVPHHAEKYGLGLPLKDICPSDHISLVAEFSLDKGFSTENKQ